VRSIVRVVVDRDGGIDLDAVADASRLASATLDAAEEDPAGSPLPGPYVLEVTSPGVDRPLAQPRHWRRARGRLVSVRRRDGGHVEGRVLGADDEGADLAVPVGPAVRGRPPRRRVVRILFAEVALAAVQVEFGAVEELDADLAGLSPTGAARAAGADDADDADDHGAVAENADDHDAEDAAGPDGDVAAGRPGPPTGKEMNR
jgi:ribosome maturation factor RimP